LIEHSDIIDENIIQEGSDVLFLLDTKRTFLINIKAGEKLHTHKGFIPNEDLIGKKYGEKVLSSLGYEFVALKPTIYDYIKKARRSTQIIYPKDIALIVVYSNIGPGSRVVEAGTGSGALTCALAHYVKPNGRVYSYEIREEFLPKARKNLKKAHVLEYVELKNKDIISGIFESNLDAVILDLATPWLVIQRAYTALRGSGCIVSFSPTIEQVVKTVIELEKNEFVGIVTIECIMRKIKVKEGATRPETLMRGHSGYITYARKAFKKSNDLKPLF
jgi:tRNA (adenine57-N1/adenine58-N1)-methyltransferase